MTATKPNHPWSNATYSASTLSWYYDWNDVSSGNYTIWTSATDFAGHVTEVSRNVAVSNVDVIYVSPSGDDTSGSSWATAKKTVAGGMTAATSGKEVWVAAGEYVQAAALSMKSGVGLYGGFAGVETAREQRDWVVNKSVIDGDHTVRVITMPTGATSTTVVDGFVIRNGKATSGGGIYCYYASPKITRNTIIGNSASSMGGGVYSEGGSPTITGNSIVGNSTSGTGSTGGGIYCYYGSPVLANNLISSNSALSNGGGIYCNSSSATIANNTVVSNFAVSNGGGLACYNSSLSIVNDLIAYNSSGVFKSGTGTLTVHNDCVYQNAAYNYSGLTDPTGTNGNISTDPKFASLEYRDIRLQTDSPCIGAGDNNVVQSGWTDLDGQARIQPTGGTVDIGVDESDGTQPVVNQRVVRVSTDGTDTNDGSTWQLAKRTVQAAIYDVSCSGGEVWVKLGQYNGPATIYPFVHVYGGFYGNEITRSQRNWGSNVTILDGLQAENVVTINCSPATLDGLTIRNGKTRGIYCTYGSPSIANNTVTANSGGGVYCSYGGPSIIGNTITENSFSNGGGIYCDHSSALIENNTLSRNTGISGSYGGGIYCYSSSITAVNNAISRNSATYGGGIYCNYSSANIANNLVSANSAGSGGGIYCSAGTPSIANNTIVANSSGSSGGGVYCSNSAASITNVIVAYNSSGVYVSGSAPTIHSSCVYGNTINNFSGLTDPTGTNGNISADPKFASLEYGDIHLQTDSPCIGAGDNSAVQTGWMDLDGQARIQPTGGTVDIGVDESDGTQPAVNQRIVRVSTGGIDTNDGSTWQLAKRTVQSAIEAVSETGGEVWVKVGRYYERISLRQFAHVYGGFSGSETNRSQRNWVTNVTTLDGQHGGSVVSSGFGPTTIDGFTITNGNGAYGGGINSSYGPITVSNNTVTGNLATYGGGGIYCSSGTSSIVGNRIAGNSVGNYSSKGGGIYCSSCTATVVNNTIIGNSGSDSGGGIYSSSSPAVLSNNTICDNSAASGGGVYCSSGSPSVANNIIAFNSSGIHNNGATISLRNNCVFTNTDYNYSTGLSAGQGDISSDPSFADREFGNFHIQPGSYCIGAGWNSAPGMPVTDADGQARILPENGVVDVGADESDGTTWPTGPSKIIRVSPAGADTNDGSTWQLAMRSVRAGVDAAAAQGGEVWVKSGIYDERIALHPCVHLYGGFNGSETAVSQRNWRNNSTVLDGHQGGSVVVMNGHCTLDGFTIRNGKPDVSGSTGAGGIYCDRSSGSIANNIVVGNVGGIYCNYASPTIANNRVIGNSICGNVGGIDCHYASPVITSNTISANSGGGLYCYYGSPSITNNTITENVRDGSYGGGIRLWYGSPSIANNIITFNSSGVCKEVTGGSPTLRNNCVFANGTYNYYGLTDPTGTNGNISADPKLASKDYGDMHVQTDSPCINAGYNGVVQSGWVDLDGQARVQPIGGSVDIGVDESDGTQPVVAPRIVRVSTDGDDLNDGSSWSLAERSVQFAIDTASSAGGEVWVKEGEYYERVVLRPFVHVFGGFCGEEVAEEDRDTGASGTILDGQQAGSVVTAQSGSMTIDGFTIRNGKAQNGGGIYCYLGSPYIANNVITANSADARGGGLYSYVSSPQVVNNAINGNTATSVYYADGGGGLYCMAGSPSIMNNTITNNYARSGGGMHCLYLSGGLFANNVVVSNAATDGAGVYLDSSYLSITNNTVSMNIVTGTGGALYCYGNEASIVNNVLAFNTSGLFKYGSGTPVLRNNCAYQNTSFNYSGLTDPTGTDGNIATDPRLANVQTGDVHIQPDSPCVGTGYNAAVQSDWTDVDGEARTQPENGVVDIGADESDGTAWTATPRIVRVCPDGDDTLDGSSWEVAKKTVQAAVDVVSAVGGEVWVQSGTYRESITVPSFVQLYGGFDGTEDERSARNWISNATILGAPGLNGRVITIDGSQQCVIDGFIIQNGSASNGGGIYCSNALVTIANNIIRNNSSTSDGGGIYCYNSSPTIINNWLTGNTAFRSDCHGGGIYCENSIGSIVSNTITNNAAQASGGAIYLQNTTSALVIANNVLTSNTSGIGNYSGQPASEIRNNDVWSNGTQNYSWTPAPTGDISVDPKLSGVHIQSGSPCIDAGWNSAPGLASNDIDGQARVQPTNGTVDIGADESGGATWRTVTITASPEYCAVGGQITYTINVKDPAEQPVADCLVSVQVTASTITSITNNVVNGTIDDPPLSGSCPTNTSGNVYVVVTAGDDYDANRFMSIAAQAAGVSGLMSVQSLTSNLDGGGNASLNTFCYDPYAETGLVICFDVTGSMSGGAAAKGGLESLVGFIKTHAPWIKIGGIKVEDTLCHSLAFTRDHDSVAQWIDLGYQSGDCILSSGDDDPELQLDALASASSSVSSCCRKFIALATNSGFHFAGDGCFWPNGDPLSTLTVQDVAELLTASGAETYIDGDTASGYYGGLAINGSIEGSLGTFSFPNLRQAIMDKSRGGVDLDIDSDNDNGDDSPDRSDGEDKVENSSAKEICVNAGDIDNDGVPGFADGFNWDGISSNSDDVSADTEFVPMVLELKSPLDPSTAQISLTYDASDPSGVTREGTDPDYTYTPAAGYFRIWTKDGNQARNKADITSGGDYVPSGTFTGPQLGFSSSNRTVILYVEAVRSEEAGAMAQAMAQTLATTTTSSRRVKVTITECTEDEIKVKASPTTALTINAVYVAYRSIGGDNFAFPFDNTDVVIKAMVVATVDGEKRVYTDLGDKDNAESGWRNGNSWHIYGTQGSSVPGNWPDYRWLSDVSSKFARVYQWNTASWGTPTFTWKKRYHHCSAKGSSGRKYDYHEASPSWTGWGTSNTGTNFLAPGLTRLRVTVKLDTKHKTSPDNEKATRIAVRSHSDFGTTNASRRDYLRWIFAYKGEPYQLGGYWFGGKASDTWRGTGNGYGIDCRGLVSVGARWAGYNWGNNEGTAWVHYTGSLYSGSSVTTETFLQGDPFGPGDILCYYREYRDSRGRKQHEGHVVSVFYRDGDNISIIEAAGGSPNGNPAGSVVRVQENQSLEDWLDDPYNDPASNYKQFRLVAQ